MKLRSVAVNQFKKFSSPVRLAGIGDGLNVVIGPNEMGKSTLLDALRAALFEKHNSKAQPIVALQNDRNEAGPVVELAFELGDGLYRITKRFIKKPYARLSCPDGRILEGDAAEDTLRNLLGFDEPGKTGAKAETLGMWNVLWVQQGQSFGQFEIPITARSSLHSALEAEVGTVLGGRRGRALPQVIEAQILTLITSAGKPRGLYKDLIDRTEALREDFANLQQRRTELSQTFEELEIARENLARLSVVERDQADQNELIEAQQHHSQVAELEARISNASTELELKKLNLAQAEKAAQERQHLNDEIEGEETALKGFTQRLAAAKEQEEGGRLRLNALRANVREQEAVVTKADDAVSHAQRILAVIGRRARISELESRSANAQAAEERYRQAQQEAAAILVTDHLLQQFAKPKKIWRP